MNKYLKHLLWLGLLGLSGSAYAQAPHVCGGGPGPNEVMAGMNPGGHGVGPTPLCYWKQQSQQGGSQQPKRTYLEDTWGAIATDKVKGAFGTSVRMSSEKAAVVVAESECRNKGNGDNCEVFATYVNSCIAMVVGNNRAFTQSADTIDQASKIALNNCKAEGSECRVYYSECSKPRLLPY